MGSRLRHAKKNREYYDPNTGGANYDMDQRVGWPADPASEPRRSAGQELMLADNGPCAQRCSALSKAWLMQARSGRHAGRRSKGD